jgi:hypothetical protein
VVAEERPRGGAASTGPAIYSRSAQIQISRPGLLIMVGNVTGKKLKVY